MLLSQQLSKVWTKLWHIILYSARMKISLQNCPFNENGTQKKSNFDLVQRNVPRFWRVYGAHWRVPERVCHKMLGWKPPLSWLVCPPFPMAQKVPQTPIDLTWAKIETHVPRAKEFWASSSRCHQLDRLRKSIPWDFYENRCRSFGWNQVVLIRCQVWKT